MISLATASISPRDCRNWPSRGESLISGPVYDQVHNKLSIGFDCLSRQQLKNVANPVTGYRVLQGAAASRPPASQPDARKGSPLHLHLPRIARRPASSLAPWEWFIGCLSQRRDDRHRRLLVCDQRVQRPQGHLGSVARRGIVVDRFFAGEQEQAVVERGQSRTRMGVDWLKTHGPVRRDASRARQYRLSDQQPTSTASTLRAHASRQSRSPQAP